MVGEGVCDAHAAGRQARRRVAAVDGQRCHLHQHDVRVPDGALQGSQHGDARARAQGVRPEELAGAEHRSVYKLEITDRWHFNSCVRAGRVFGIIGQDPCVPKSNRLYMYVEIFSIFFLCLKYFL